jgi:predicted GNAT superfamily acetyltransferase
MIARTKLSSMKKTSRSRSGEKIVTIKGRKFLFRVEDSDSPADYIKYEELRNAVWQYPQDSLPGGRNMMCENFLHDGSSLFIGVFVEDKQGGLLVSGEQLVGFSYGFVGLKGKDLGFRTPDNLQFYSQYNAVREGFRGFHLGVLIKEFQREQVRDGFGLETITCTYDPLTAVNAYRNIHHFGMDVLAYRTDIYGEFGGLLNRLDVPRDRLFVSWDLNKEGRKPECDLRKWLRPEHCVIETERIEVSGKSGPIELEVIREVRSALDRDLLLVEIPADFYLMLRETDVADKNVQKIPVDWRMKTRQVFQSLLGKGYRVGDFCGTKTTPRGYFYVLERTRSPKT